ncbi:Transcriptional regulatory protein DegU [Pontiella desulfatans]|uniref:Transcriptional regulatory protein DegU n=1 Tax=Pontiella desulfatans TaxID=2750659 RepID=A0A6C2U8H7_PONDE|nr:response regulator transcription factor [Pontiella desulfatans]VGO16408.1 Transcriptional regulatory protein DegU [Pontiella desulfatans]
MIPINIWLVEDDANYRRNLRMSLELEEHITVERVFPSCIEFFEALETNQAPDVVLMDLGLPGMSGLDAIRKLSTEAPDLAAMVLTVFKDKQKVLEALDAGAAGYLLKESEGPDIVKALQQVFMGGSALSPAVAKIVVQELRKPAPSDEFNLSQREIQVLEKLADGLAVKEISDVLNISISTAGFHLSNIYKKLQVQSQTGAVAKALRSGLI